MTDAVVAKTPAERVPAWDLPTRLFKWALVATVASAWISNKIPAVSWHVWNGYAVLVLVVFRLLWGVVGGSTARFSAFLRSPIATLRYGLALVAGREGHYLGHNPLGGWMVLLLLGLAGAIGLTGLMNADVDRYGIIEGPLSAKLSDATFAIVHSLHHRLFDLLLIAVVLHVGAVAFHSVFKKDRIVPAMVTGLKPAGDYVDQKRATYGSAIAAIACLVAAIAIVWGGVWLAK